MRVLHERCAGLDVHKKSVTACVITPEGREVQQFGSTTSELLRLAEWLLEKRVTHVAMESAGAYSTGVQPAGGARAYPAARQRASHEGGAGPQDRR